MTDSPTLRDLIARLETEQPSRELDALTWIWTLPQHGDDLNGIKIRDDCHFEYEADERGAVSQNVRLPDGRVNKLVRRPAPHHTSSIDAKLPGEDDGYWIVQGPRDIGWLARFHPVQGSIHPFFESFARTEAMARRAAFLKYLLAEQNND